MALHIPRALRRTVVALLLLGFCGGIWLVSPRLLVLPVAACVALSACLAVVSSRWRPFVLSALVFVLLCFSPLDVRLQSRGPSPRIVPVVMGLPSAGLAEESRKGNVWLGGCIVRGTEPVWVLLL